MGKVIEFTKQPKLRQREFVMVVRCDIGELKDDEADMLSALIAGSVQNALEELEWEFNGEYAYQDKIDIH